MLVQRRILLERTLELGVVALHDLIELRKLVNLVLLAYELELGLLFSLFQIS